MKVYNVVLQKQDGSMVQKGVKADDIESALTKVKVAVPNATVISAGFAAQIDVE